MLSLPVILFTIKCPHGEEQIQLECINKETINASPSYECLFYECHIPTKCPEREYYMFKKFYSNVMMSMVWLELATRFFATFVGLMGSSNVYFSLLVHIKIQQVVTWYLNYKKQLTEISLSQIQFCSEAEHSHPMLGHRNHL